MNYALIYACLTWAQYLIPTQNVLLIAGGFTVVSRVLFAEPIEYSALYLSLCILVRVKAPATRIYNVWDVLAQSILPFVSTNLPFYFIVDASWNDVQKIWLFATVYAVSTWLVSDPVYVTMAILSIHMAEPMIKRRVFSK